MSTEQATDVPYGFCQCGCGARTRIALYSNRSKGEVAGVPVRFCSGHNGRKAWAYAVEPRGYKSACWVWLLSIRPDGYGQYRLDGRPRLAHRIAYERANGVIPDGLELDHLCRVRACVNPDHLEPVTNRENTRRGGRVKLTPATVREIRRRESAGESQAELAREFGVAPGTIWHVVAYVTWADVS